MTEQQGVQLDANAVAATTATKSAAVSWPFPVDRRLDQLVNLANEAGANTRRQELAAALVASSSTKPDQLLELIIRWRKQLVRDIVLDIPQAAQVVDIPRYRPGRRRIGS
ncbi:MAG TPA: hypothetical protein VF612_16985 [Jatrophihabitans sp.]|jgi:hypothetical protein|uniref:hypothetical protein n=1 Tax=Jatrophihabitans sp. TaxID=1932789 RepID=UPI002F1F3564